ncbi:MAG: hypothetical protein ACI4SD_06175 [Suilimivivens sp.]
MRKKTKQIAALICVALLVLLYIATLVIALLDFPGSDRMFGACLMATIGLPILLWIYIWVYGKFTGRHTITDAVDLSAASKDSASDHKEES